MVAARTSANQQTYELCSSLNLVSYCTVLPANEPTCSYSPYIASYLLPALGHCLVGGIIMLTLIDVPLVAAADKPAWTVVLLAHKEHMGCLGCTVGQCASSILYACTCQAMYLALM